MPKFYNFIFDWRYANMIKRLQNVPFKMKIATERLRSACILQVSNDTERICRKLKRLIHKAGMKRAEHAGARLNRNLFSKETVIDNPVFTHAQMAELKKYLPTLWLVFLFIFGETSLNYIVSCCFLPGASDYVKYPFALFLSIIGMMGLHVGYSRHFAYKEALHTKDSIDAYELENYRDKCLWGYAILALTFIGIIAAGFVRIFFTEEIPPDGLSQERLHSLIQVGKYSGIFTMSVTLTSAMLLAGIKHEQAKRGISFFINRKLQACKRKNERYHIQLLDQSEMLRSTVDQCMEKNWQLITRLKELFRLEEEFDLKYLALNKEYVELKSRPDFSLTDALYLKFNPLQCSYEEIFKYGILHTGAIKEKLQLAAEAEKMANRHVEEHTPAFMDAAKETVAPYVLDKDIVKPTNGTVKHALSVMLALIAISLFSCTKPKPSVIVTLPDLSKSRDTTVLNWYKAAIVNGVIAHMGPKDRLIGLPIDGASETYSQEIFTVDFSNNVYGNEFAGLQSAKLEKKSHHDSLVSAGIAFSKAFDAAVVARRRFAKETDIIGALKQAGKYYVPNCDSILVLFSDMEQETDRQHINLATTAITKSDYPSLLSQMEVSDLHGINVIIITGEQANISLERYELLKGLWTLYIQKCGGKLISYDSGSLTSLTRILNK